MVTPDPEVLRYGDPERVISHLINMLNGADTSKIIVLLPCPQGTSIETARLLAQTIADRYGTKFEGDLLK